LIFPEGLNPLASLLAAVLDKFCEGFLICVVAIVKFWTLHKQQVNLKFLRFFCK